jgi:hypothetical protein
MPTASTVELGRAGWGLTQLVAAPSIARGMLGGPPDAVTVRAMRILGARQLIQAVVLGRSASRSAHLIGAGVDAIHAASMIVVAVASARRRRAAIAELLTASAFAVCEFLLS